MNVPLKYGTFPCYRQILKFKFWSINGLTFINPEAYWCLQWMMATLHQGELIILITKCVSLKITCYLLLPCFPLENKSVHLRTRITT